MRPVSDAAEMALEKTPLEWSYCGSDDDLAGGSPPPPGIPLPSRRSQRDFHVLSVPEGDRAELRAAIEAAGSFKFLVMSCEFDMEALLWGEHMAELDPHLSLVSDRSEDRNCIHRPAWFADWLGGAGHPKEAEHILDSTKPDYEAVKANDGENFNPGFPLILVGGRAAAGALASRAIPASGILRESRTSSRAAASAVGPTRAAS